MAGIGTFLSVFFLFTVAISRQEVGDESIQVGDTIPHFTTTGEKGENFDSHKLAGQPVLIKLQVLTDTAYSDGRKITAKLADFLQQLLPAVNRLTSVPAA